MYTAEEADALAKEKGWTFKPDGDSMRRVVPSPQPKRIFGLGDDPGGCSSTAASSSARAAAGSRSCTPTKPVPAGRRLVGIEAVIDKDLASALLAADLEADVARDRHRRRRASTRAGARPSSGRSGGSTPEELATSEFAEGSMGPKVKAACTFVEQTGGRAVIGSITDTQALLAGEAGTTVALAEAEVK